MASIELPEGYLLALGSPMLDITATADEEFLKKYDLKANDATRADEKHKYLIEDMIKNYQPVTFTSGGSTGNTVRVFQWLVEKPRLSAFTGCIAKDGYGQILEEKAREAGVDIKFQYHPALTTATCAVVITDQNRSLVADLAASSHFSLQELCEEHQNLIDNAQYFYVEGFFLTVSFETVLHLAKQFCGKCKVVGMNLSAPFICRDHADKVEELLPYTDVLFGNREEARILFQSLRPENSEDSKRYEDENYEVQDIALWIASYQKANTGRDRVVVITQDGDPVLLATKNGITSYALSALEPAEIVDTNGAGDAFVGGFLSQMVQGHKLEMCVKCGIYAAKEVIKRVGCTFPSKHSFSG